MSIQTWLLYVVAVFVLTVTPGPSVLMCVTNGVNYGARRTLFSALGSITAVVGIMVCFELFWLMFYASFASRITPWLRAKGRARMFNRVAGVTFIGAGALLASVKRVNEA